MIFIDSSYFIALAYEKDRWHSRAVKLTEKLPDEKLATEFTISESVTTVGALGGGKAGESVYEYIIGNCEIVFVDKELLESTIPIYLKYDGTLSVADAVSIEIMRRRGVKKIISFDADFDKVPGISRVH